VSECFLGVRNVRWWEAGKSLVSSQLVALDSGSGRMFFVPNVSAPNAEEIYSGLVSKANQLKVGAKTYAWVLDKIKNNVFFCRNVDGLLVKGDQVAVSGRFRRHGTATVVSISPRVSANEKVFSNIELLVSSGVVRQHSFLVKTT
jgi:hypothetical protein